MNKIVFAPILVVLTIFGAPNFAFAHSDSEHFQVGWTDGVNQAMSDTNSGSGYNSNCPDGHSISYCNGYTVGYNHYWYSADHSNLNFNARSSQDAGVNIHGNNNRVQITQQTNQQFGDNGGSSGGHGFNPRCIILCAAVRVN